MLTTFNDTASPATGAGDNSALRPRPKRRQVVRACEWCRKHRTKCDNNYPCSNCNARGEQCSNETIKATTLPHAYREIDRLKRQVQILELELEEQQQKQRQQQQQQQQQQQHNNNRKNIATCRLEGPSQFTPPRAVSGSDGAGFASSHVDLQKLCGGIHIGTPRSSPQKSWYGPSSLFYFIGRVTRYLSSTLPQSDPSDQVLPKNPITMLLDGSSPTTHKDELNHGLGLPTNEVLLATGECYLSPTQEEYFLDLFWQSYHTCVLPILDEAEFREYYRSLWGPSREKREPSALVDIVLAICMQYGVSMLPTARHDALEGTDATVSGRLYYRRCQMLLAYELESPTISTLQCHLLCAIYLCFGFFQNMADSACSLAVRAAYMLGLHVEPPETMPQRERELRKRLWWTLYLLDSKVGMKLGRPFLLQRSSAEPRFPGDGQDVAAQSGSHYAPLDASTTWLSFSVRHTRLFLAAREAHAAFYNTPLENFDSRTVWEDPRALGVLAQLLQPHVKDLEDWAEGVPASLRTGRRGNGRPFSTDGSRLEIETFSPLWLQRQRLLLELMYHNLCTNLFRPLISFGGLAAADTLAGEIASRCALHAMALTQITHQVLSETSILTGWLEAFQWLWNAAMTLVGFLLAYPDGAMAIEVRRAVDLSVATFDIFGNSFVAGKNAARIVRDLGIKVDLLLEQSRRPCAGMGEDRAAAEETMTVGELEGGYLDLIHDSSTLDLDGMAAATIQDIFQLFDLSMEAGQ